MHGGHRCRYGEIKMVFPVHSARRLRLGFGGDSGTKHNVISNCASYRKVFSYSHETTLDIRCHIRPEFAAGNPTFRGVALRSPPARCLARGAWTDLPGGRRVARRRSAFGRVLGSSLPT